MPRRRRWSGDRSPVSGEGVLDGYGGTLPPRRGRTSRPGPGPTTLATCGAHVGRQVLAAGEFDPDVGGCSNHDPAAQSGSGLAVGAAAGGVAQLLELEPGPEVLPIARTRSRRCRCGPGSPPAWREADQVYLFPGNAPGKPLGDIKTFWRHVCRDAGLEGVRLHDLRHTYASSLVSRGVSLHIVGRLLGHKHRITGVVFFVAFVAYIAGALWLVAQAIRDTRLGDLEFWQSADLSISALLVVVVGVGAALARVCFTPQSGPNGQPRRTSAHDPKRTFSRMRGSASVYRKLVIPVAPDSGRAAGRGRTAESSQNLTPALLTEVEHYSRHPVT